MLNQACIANGHITFFTARKIARFQDFKILIRIRTPNRGIDPTVTHIHETITTQKKTIEESFKED